MNAGKLKDRITIKRLTKVSDGFGGFNSTLSNVKTMWCSLKETNGEIKDEFGKRERYVEIELLARKKSTNDITIGDIFVIEGNTDKFRINNMYQSKLDFYVEMKATKID
tara:strand:- start:248 stop:574 length:327 start_codon:yes stop_codon:yes gene_type:complete